MKRGDRVPVTEAAQKPPARMFSYKDAGLQARDVVLPAGTVLYHVSEQKRLTAFAPVVTCFSLARPVLTGHVYIAICTAPVSAVQMDDLEVRVDLATAPVEIYYAGTRKMDFRRVAVDRFGRVAYVPRRCYFAARFRHLAAEINAAEKQENSRFYGPAYQWVSRDEVYK